MRFEVVTYIMNEYDYKTEQIETTYTYAIEDTMSDCESMEFINEDDAKYICELFNQMSDKELIERWVKTNE